MHPSVRFLGLLIGFLCSAPPLGAESQASLLRAHRVLKATTNAYPGDRTEIWVEIDPTGNLQRIVLEEFNLSEPLRKTQKFELPQVNSAEGVVLKTELTVTLLRMRGIEGGLQSKGGWISLEYRKSNWFSDHGKLDLQLKNDQGRWRAFARLTEVIPVDELRILTWTGLGFGIEEIEPITGLATPFD